MQNPARIVNMIVEKLRAIPAVVRACGNNPQRIYAYNDAPPSSASLGRAIYQMQSPSVMVAWMGTGPSAEEGMAYFTHEFSIFLCAEDNTFGENNPTYANLVTAIINGRATGDSNRFIDSQFIPELETMRVPTVKRITDDVGEHDRWEMATRIDETIEDSQDTLEAKTAI